MTFRYYFDAVRVFDVKILGGRELPTQTGDLGLPTCCGCAKVLLHGLEYLDLTFNCRTVCQKLLAWVYNSLYHVYGSGKNTKNDSSLSLHMSAMSAMSACKFVTSVKRGNDLTTSLGKKHSPLHLNGTQIDGLTFSLMGACLCLRAWHSLRVFLVMRMKFVKKSLTRSIFLDKWWEYCEQIDASQSRVGIQCVRARSKALCIFNTFVEILMPGCFWAKAAVITWLLQKSREIIWVEWSPTDSHSSSVQFSERVLHITTFYSVL